MRTLLTLAVALLACTGLARSQDDEPSYEELFNEGIEALSSGRHQEGIDLFTRCLELVPEDSTCAYNIACGHALMGETEPAFAWLDKCAAWGYGIPTGSIEHARQDTDLDSLHGDERWEAWLETLEESRAAVREQLDALKAEAAVYVPASAPEEGPIGVLVVLHDMGSTKDAIVEGRWKGLADEAGVALIAPSAGELLGRDVATDLGWFGDYRDYERRPDRYEETVRDAVAKFREDREVDPARVVIAGEGQGGAVAFNVAVSEPSFYRGVVSLDGPPLLGLAQTNGPAAGAAGLAFHGFFDKAGIWGVPRADVQPYGGQVRNTFRTWRIDGGVVFYDRDPEQPDAIDELLREALSELLPSVARPVEAGAGGADNG